MASSCESGNEKLCSTKQGNFFISQAIINSSRMSLLDGVNFYVGDPWLVYVPVQLYCRKFAKLTDN
jgi:hypothetical protein